MGEGNPIEVRLLDAVMAGRPNAAKSSVRCTEGGGTIIYVLSGNTVVTTGDFSCRMGAHDLLTLFHGSEIRMCDTTEDFRAFLISYDASIICDADLRGHLRNSAAAIDRHPVVGLSNAAQAKLLESYFVILHDINSHPEITFRAEIVKNLLEAALFSIGGIYRDGFPAHDTVAEFNFTRKEEIVKRFQALVSLHCISERSTAFYADRLCVTPKHLASTVKEVSGLTPTQTISRAVTADAKSKLKSTDMSVAEIADSLNFPNPSFFCKYFRRHTGFSPRSYRNVMRESESGKSARAAEAVASGSAGCAATKTFKICR